MLQKVAALCIRADGAAYQGKAHGIRHVAPVYALLAIQGGQRIGVRARMLALTGVQRMIGVDDRRAVRIEHIDLFDGMRRGLGKARLVRRINSGFGQHFGDDRIGKARTIPLRIERQNQLWLERADARGIAGQKRVIVADRGVHGVARLCARRAAVPEERQVRDAERFQYLHALLRVIAVLFGEIIDLHRQPVFQGKISKHAAEQLQFVARLIQHDQHVGLFAGVGKRRHERLGAGGPFGQHKRAVGCGQLDARDVLRLDRNQHLHAGDLIGPIAFQVLPVCVEEMHLKGIGLFKEMKEQVRCPRTVGERHGNSFAAIERQRRERVAVVQVIDIGLRFGFGRIGTGKQSVPGLVRSGRYGGGQQKNGGQKYDQNGFEDARHFDPIGSQPP